MVSWRRRRVWLGVAFVAALLLAGISRLMSALVLHVRAHQVVLVAVSREDGRPAAGARVQMGFGRWWAAADADPEGRATLELTHIPGCDTHWWPLPDHWTCRAKYPDEVWVRAEHLGASAEVRIPLSGDRRYEAEHDVRLVLAPPAGPR